MWWPGLCTYGREPEVPPVRMVSDKSVWQPWELGFVRDPTPQFTVAPALAVFLNDRWTFDRFNSRNEQRQRCNRLFSSTLTKFLSAKPSDRNSQQDKLDPLGDSFL